MKKLLLLILPLLTLCFVACEKYDDTGLRKELTSLKDRVAKLEELCKTLNTDISSLKTIVEALQNNDYVTSYSALTDGSGYQITFAKSGAIIIKHGTNGKDGTNGTDGTNAPVIGVALDDGIYYWTITTNGTTTWLTGDGAAKLRVTGENGTNGINGGNGKSAYELAVEKGYSGTLEQWLVSLNGTNGSNGSNGKSAYELAVELGYTGTLQEWLALLAGTNGTNGITPILGVDASGFWTIDKGDGSGIVRLKDTNGQDVKAVGIDGTNGTNGSNGANGTSVFKGVAQDNNNVYFTLSDDSVITVPKGVGFSFTVDATGTQLFEYGETKTYTITQSNITNTSVSAPNGWRAVINGNILSITASNIENSYAENEGIITIVATSSDNRSIIVNINATIKSDYIKFIDPNLRVFILGRDTNSDGKISKTEAEQTVNLYIRNKSVYSFDEIKYFTSITSLNLSNDPFKDLGYRNQLTSLDLSQNINLNTLNCSYNSLTYLRIANLSTLVDVNLDNNNLTSLDLSGCSSLQTLALFGNYLITLNLSGCSSLKTLSVGGNNLASLDLSDCSSLQTLTFDGGKGGNVTTFTSLDVSNCTSLTTLNCAGNPNLTELWLATGQTIPTLSKDAHTVIKYK